ncbi:MAG: hypothetical protein H7256_00240, partial [Bdellovibrio sp.]|nr:hypothetical protein [Bdellovibrio sp.]
MKSNIFKTLFVSSMLVVTACTKQATKETLNPLLKDSSNIISTRPQNSKQFIAVLKLKNPAL